MGTISGARTSAEGSRSSLLALDPDLGNDLDAADLAAARRLLVPVTTARVGAWRPPRRLADSSADLGFLVVEGLLMRRVMIADTRCTELLGRGDVLRPWSMDAAEISSVPIEADWRVVDQPARFAVLDRNVTRQLGRWPQVTCQLFDRTVRRARWLSFQLAVCHTKYVQARLLMILWHFADRWGRMRRDGVLVELQLSHQTLGEIVGARRPTVTSALGELREEGKLRALDDGRWLLLGEPPRPTIAPDR
ncbi:MAG TPA: helix-turn-helix domain-containing protein [Solirubrobacterales bacterium]|nr:helix-turn-helix domain-containing protein [Solirubrobacterales bacterium]